MKEVIWPLSEAGLEERVERKISLISLKVTVDILSDGIDLLILFREKEEPVEENAHEIIVFPPFLSLPELLKAIRWEVYPVVRDERPRNYAVEAVFVIRGDSLALHLEQVRDSGSSAKEVEAAVKVERLKL